MKPSFLLGLGAILGGAAVSVFALAAAFDPHLSFVWSLVPAASSLGLFAVGHRALATEPPAATAAAKEVVS